MNKLVITFPRVVKGIKKKKEIEWKKRTWKNVKTCNEYDNDPIKCLLNQKKNKNESWS